MLRGTLLCAFLLAGCSLPRHETSPLIAQIAASQPVQQFVARLQQGDFPATVLRPGARPPSPLPGPFDRVDRAAIILYQGRASGVVLIAARDRIATGALISARGDIVTNAHVVHNAHHHRGEEWLAVWFKPRPGSQTDQDKFLLAKVVHRDRQRDLALLRLSTPPPPEATTIPLADTLPDIGQEVFVIGHPRNYPWSLTRGIVSQIRPAHRWNYADNVPRVATAIQMQVPVNPGNSGGPLLDGQGRLLGVVAASVTEHAGISFAVAVQHVQELLNQ